ncbi:MAG: lipoyl(octanoyl) transferase LipB [Saprospiraceae bacterium]
MPKVIYKDLKIISYKKAWDYQKEIQQTIIKNKRESSQEPVNRLLFCEHKPVYTIGKSGKMDHLVFNEKQLLEAGIEFYKTNRGGDITYHGPGQITGYPIFDLDQFYHDVHRYVRDLEQVVINVLTHFGLKGERLEGFTGVWLLGTSFLPIHRKICAIGVHMSRWVTLHGLALNVNTDLNHFQGIIPCGIKEDNKMVTSLNAELESDILIDDVKKLMKKEFQTVFGIEYL